MNRRRQAESSRKLFVLKESVGLTHARKISLYKRANFIRGKQSTARFSFHMSPINVKFKLLKREHVEGLIENCRRHDHLNRKKKENIAVNNEKESESAQRRGESARPRNS